MGSIDLWQKLSTERGEQMRGEPRPTTDVAVRERRDPSAATMPVTNWQTPGTPMVPRWDADNAIQWAYYANVIVWRCMQILAAEAMACPFRAGKLPPSEPGVKVPDNPDARLAQLLGPPPGGPAPKLTARRLWAWSIVQRKVTGRFGWEIETSQRGGKGEVLALWPLVAAQLKAVPSQRGTDWWQGFVYGQPPNERKLNPDQVHYGWDPAIDDWRQPESCLQAARLDVSIAVMGDRYSYGFLKNDARPAAIVVTEAFATDEEFRRFKGSWYGEYGGPDNAGKTSFVELPEDRAADMKPSEAVNVQVLGLSQRDARFVEQHRDSLEHVAMACGVPWSRLNAADRTFDNAGQEDENFWMDTMLPLLSDMADEVNVGLAPRLGSEVGWFDLSHVKVFQPRRRFASMQDAKYALDAQVVVPNEVRADIGLDPRDGGDEPLPLPAPFASPVARAAHKGDVLIDEWFDSDGRPWETRDALTHTHMHVHSDGTIHSHLHSHAAGVEDHGDFAQVTHSHTHTASAPQLERRDTDRAEIRARAWRLHDATVTTLEARWGKAMRRLFDRQAKSTLARLAGNRGRRALADGTPDPDEIFDPAFWRTQTVDDVEALYEACTTQGFARISAQFGISFDLEAPYARDFIDARANQLAGQVTDTTYQAIKDQLAQGVADGDSIPDLAARIRDVFDAAGTVRSTLIARTEVNSAVNGSASLAMAELPSDVIGGQEWLATMDDRTRDEHATADGQVVGIGEPFDVGGEPLAYPGDGSPENACNCRCTVLPLTPDEMPQRSKPDVVGVFASIDRSRPFDELAVRRRLNQETAA